MKLENKNILVTGGAGFIGSHLVDRLMLESPNNLVVVDNLFLGKLENIKDSRANIRLLDASLENEMRELLTKYNIDVVFNLAVIPLGVSLVFPSFCFNKNISITSNLCELLRLGFYKTLIHFSSSEVYGTAEYVPMDEKHPLNGITPYAASKIACDQLVFSYIKTFNLDASIIRPFNAYGPRQNENNYAGVIPKTIARLQKGRPPIIEGSGNQTRDFTYVTDIASAAVKIYECQKSRGLAINIASGGEISIHEIIDKLNSDNLGVIYKNKRIGDVDRHLADISLAQKLLGYTTSVNYIEGLKLTKEWYRSIL